MDLDIEMNKHPKKSYTIDCVAISTNKPYFPLVRGTNFTKFISKSFSFNLNLFVRTL